VENLVANAWKYTGKTQDPRIEFRAEEGVEGTVFVIRDNGAGFDMTQADRLFQPFANWDGTWYIRIASQGYNHKPGSWAFFPLYPWLLHGTADATRGQYVVAGMLLSIAAALAAAALLYLLVEGDYGRRVALWSVAFLAFFPTSIFFQAVYTESLFLLASLACILWARRGRWGRHQRGRAFLGYGRGSRLDNHVLGLPEHQQDGDRQVLQQQPPHLQIQWTMQRLGLLTPSEGDT